MLCSGEYAKSVCELRFVGGVAVFGDPEFAGGKEVIAQHVEHAHAAEHGAAEIGALDGDRRGQQTAVGAPVDGQLFAAGVPGGNQPLGGGDEVVEDVLLVAEHARLVPCVAIFIAAAQVGHGIDAALLDPVQRLRMDRRGSG